MIAQDKLEKIVGADNLSIEQDILDEYSSDMSFVNRVRPACVVRPKKEKDIQKIIDIANETQTPLVPVSSGPPHFRGDTVPCNGGSVSATGSHDRAGRGLWRTNTFGEKGRSQAQYAFTSAKIQVCYREHA